MRQHHLWRRGEQWTLYRQEQSDQTSPYYSRALNFIVFSRSHKDGLRRRTITNLSAIATSQIFAIGVSCHEKFQILMKGAQVTLGIVQWLQESPSL